jgi:spore coat protein A
MRFPHLTHRIVTLSLALGLITGQASAQALKGPSGQLPLAPTAIPQFVQPLPLLSIQSPTPGAVAAPFSIDTQTATNLTLNMCEFDANILPPGTIAPGVQTATRVWGYSASGCPAVGPGLAKDTYIGPVIVASRGTPTTVNYVNSLPTSAAASGVLAWKYSTDQTMHWADPLNDEKNACMMKVAMGMFVDPATGMMQMYPPPNDPCAFNYSGPIPAVPHLHGGEVPAEIDGSPDSWFTSDGTRRGSKFYTKGVVGEIPTLPALPDLRFPVGAIAYETSTKTWNTVVADALGVQSWTPYAGNAVSYTYPNTQEAAPIWFHDHTLGATRLNVYAGLAGAYYVDDPSALAPTAANMPPVASVIPLVIQDRMFDTNGQLFFQASSNGGLLWALNPEHPYWSPEFVGDTIVVNGKAWPFVNVDAKRYRFLILNGSNARTYELFLWNQATKTVGPSMWVVSNDGGYLDAPQQLNPALGQKLVIMPGERYEVIIDFAGSAGSTFVMRNTAKTPYPAGATPTGNTLGRIVQFRVNPTLVAADASYDPATLLPIRSKPIVRLANAGVGAVVPAKTRELTLNEVMGMPMNAIDPVTGVLTPFPGGPLEILVNNTKWSGLDPATMAPRADFRKVTVKGKDVYFSEMPIEGETELWEIVNLTADAHPIHLHLVQFQIVNRQGFNASNYNKAYALAFGGVFKPGFGPPLDYNTGNPRALGGNPDVVPFLQGPIRPPSVQEIGWKDTVMAPPGMVTRIMVRWAPTDTATAVPFGFDPSGTDLVSGQQGTYNYVWHCHIIDHEDNEMMRPDFIQSPLIPRSYVKGRDY